MQTYKFTKNRIMPQCLFYKLLGTCIFIGVFFSSCRYYKTNHKTANVTELANLETQNNNIILHYGTQIWQLKNTEINTVQQKITGKICVLQSHQIQYCKDEEGSRRYQKRRYDPLKDLHIYTSEIAITADSNVIIPFSAIHQTADNKMHKPANFASKALLGASAIIVAIIVYKINNLEY